MLGTSGDGLITKLTSYLTADKAAPPEPLPHILDQETDPGSAAAAATSDDLKTTSDDQNRRSAKQFSKTTPRRSLKRSASELVVRSQERNEHLSATTALKAVRSKEDGRRITHTTPSPTHTQLLPPRPSSQHSISNSRYESKSRYHVSTISSASLRRQLFEQTKPSSNLPRKPDPDENKIARTARPTPIRSTAMRSKSEPDPARAFANLNTFHGNATLKPCIKKKAKSTTTTPPGGLQQNTSGTEPKTLRRVKTVDFEETGPKPSLPLPQVTVTEERSSRCPACSTGISSRLASKQTRTVESYPSCPNILSTAKSAAAEPATTRTDVHVIAIAPSRDAEGLNHVNGADPATPTMQIIETKSGSYEVIWDDVLPEHSIRTRGRRSSSASHALDAASPSAKRGLERVNSKLAGWSGTWNSPSDSFKPTIVVFPDDYGRATRYDCTVDDDDDEPRATVPPNSRMTSGAPSRVTSRPVSAPLTRTVSCEVLSLRDALQETPPHTLGAGSPPPEQSLVVPSIEMPHGRGQKTKPAAVARKLSNLEEADIKFRDHRDSVTIAHSRIVHSGAVSPESFAHRDSVSLGKKRMHARNHATSATRAISRQKELSVEALGLFADDGISVVTLPAVKEPAAHALENSSVPSILHQPQQTASKRHIRIME